MNFELKKKKFYPVGVSLLPYLQEYGRLLQVPPIYEELHRFSQLFPLYDREGQDTLWKTAFYEPGIRKELSRHLIQI